MKRFKIGIAVVVALVAMSFTLTSREVSKFATLSNGCYTVINNPGFTLPEAIHPENDLEDITDTQAFGPSVSGTKLTSATDAETLEGESLCPGNQIFCCYVVENNKVVAIAYKRSS